MRPHATPVAATRDVLPPLIRWLLFGIALVVAINAFGGAWYGLAGADGVPLEWLDGTPFDSYRIPSLFLGLVVGGSQLAACLWLALGWRRARVVTAFAASVLAAWIIVQVAMIGYVSWLQPACMVAAGASLLLLWLARRS